MKVIKRGKYATGLLLPRFIFSWTYIYFYTLNATELFMRLYYFILCCEYMLLFLLCWLLEVTWCKKKIKKSPPSVSYQGVNGDIILSCLARFHCCQPTCCWGQGFFLRRCGSVSHCARAKLIWACWSGRQRSMTGATHPPTHSPTLLLPHLLSASDFLVLGLPLKQRIGRQTRKEEACDDGSTRGDTREGSTQVACWVVGGVYTVTPISSPFSPGVRASGDNTTQFSCELKKPFGWDAKEQVQLP